PLCKKQFSTTFLFYNSIVIQNFWLVLHAFLFSDFSDYSAWVASCKTVAWNILHNHTSCSNHTIITDCDTRTNNNICPKPAVITNFNRFCITHMLRHTVFIHNCSTFIWKHWVYRRNNSHIWTKITMITNYNPGIILNRYVKIREEVITNFCMFSIMDINGALKTAILSDFVENICNDRLSFFSFIFECTVIF